MNKIQKLKQLLVSAALWLWRPVRQTSRAIHRITLSLQRRRLPAQKVLRVVYGRIQPTATILWQTASRTAAKVHGIALMPLHRIIYKHSRLYRKWYQWYRAALSRQHVRGGILASWTLLIVYVVGSLVWPVSALSTWQQSDWSGGQGSSTENQFASKDNIDIGDGSFSITPDEKLTNGGFEENLDEWRFERGQGGVFGVKSDFATGTTPDDVATADVDGDGDIDLVVPNYGSHTVSVLKNNGNGAFVSKTDYAVGLNPDDVAVGDLDGDGDIDFVVTNSGTGADSISILKNNSDGTFGNRADITVDTTPRGVALGDLDGDGDLDIVVTNHGANTVSVLRNNSDGTFEEKVDYPAGSVPRGIKLGDLDGDNDLDILVANSLGSSGSYLSTLKNNSDGTFAMYSWFTSASQPLEPSLGDLDGDGDLDIVSPVFLSNRINIHTNNGTGSFGGPSTISISSSRPYGSYIDDIDDDGDNDILIVNSALHSVSVFKNNGNNSYAARVDYGTGSSPSHVAVGDFDGDGDKDLVVSNNNSNSVSIIKNIGSAAYRSPEQSHSSNYSAKIESKSAASKLLQETSTDSDKQYLLSAYIYTNGSEVTSEDASLFVGSSTIETSYEAIPTPGWHKLSALVSGTGNNQQYGLQIEAEKILYVDNVSLRSFDSGALRSSIMDAEFGAAWSNVSYVTSGAGTVAVKVRSSNNADMSGAPAFAGCAPVVSGSDLTDQSCVTDNHRYIQYEVTLTGQDGQTPVFEDITIEYSPYDSTPPSANATNIVMKKSAGGSALSENDWTNGSTPYFEWSAATDEGTGVKGYCLYLGTDSTADPVTTKGILGNSPVATDDACQFVIATEHIDTATGGMLASALTSSSSPYYLRIKAIDNANNVYGEGSEQFSFRYDNTAPKNPDYVTAPSQFVSDKEVTLTWPTSGGNAASDAHSGLIGLQYKIGSDGVWYGSNHSGAQDSSDLLSNSGSYTTVDPEDYDRIHEGNNVVYFRTWDAAGNVSTTYVTTVIKFNSSAPTSPQNVTATPASSTSNNFAFSWVEPATFQGDANNITYCYTINTLPTANTCNWTEPGATSLPTGPYATQPGENTFYVVARDETMAINYATAASASFAANTAAPGIPQDIEIADVSTRATSNWRLALSWSAPEHTGVGIATYRVSRSTDGVNFAQVATTAGTSYVEGGLSQTEYYYKVRACDSANNCGAYSGTVRMTPTGKFTEPAKMTAKPKVSNISTKKAVISWSTDRVSDSRVSIGTTSGQYDPFQISSNVQVTDHSVSLTNLSPGTTYYLKAHWGDVDGNVGNSSEVSFKTAPAPQTQDVTTTRVGLSTAHIRFTSVGAARVVVQYGTTNAFGGAKEIDTSLNESTYDIELTGLDDGTRYVYRLNTYDADGNEYEGSTILNFTTPARPRISNLRFQPVKNEPTSTQRITWTTNVPATSLIRYTPEGSATKEVSSSKLTRDHTVVIKDLQDDTKYQIVAESRDAGGNLAVSDPQTIRTALDTRPPEISDIRVETSIRGTGAEARGQIVVSWHTDEPATSQIAYGEGSSQTDLTNRTAEDSVLSTEHIVIISDLPTSHVYTIQPMSSDESGNTANGDTSSAIIPRASDSVMTIVLNTLKRVFGF